MSVAPAYTATWGPEEEELDKPLLDWFLTHKIREIIILSQVLGVICYATLDI